MSEDDASILAKTAKGAGWVVAWRLITRTLGLCSTLALVRLLAPSDFGLVALAASFSGSIEAFSWIGLEEGVIRHAQPTQSLYDTAYTLSLLRGIVIALLIAVCAIPGADFFGEPRLAPVIVALGVSALLDSSVNIGTVEFRRDFGFQKEFRLLLLPRILSIVVALTLAATLHTYWALVAGIVANQAFRVLFSYTMHPFRPRLSLADWRQLAGYSAWNSIIAGVGVLRSRVDTILIGRVLNPATVGLYAVGYEIAELPVTELIAPLTRAAFTGFAAARRAELETGQTWLRLVAAMALLTLPAGIGMSAVAGPLIAIAFGPGWEMSVPVVEILGVAFCLTVFGMVGQTLFLAQGNMRTSASITIASVVIRVLLLLALIPPWGIAGAAAAAAIGIALEQVFSAAFAMRSLRLSLWTDLLPQTWRCALATAAMAAALWSSGLGWRPAGSSPITHAVATVPLGAAVYVATLAALWALSGRRAGPEADLLTMLRRAARQLRRAARPRAA